MQTLKRLFGVLVCMLPLAAFAMPVTIDAKNSSGTRLIFEAGTYSGRWESGGWSAWPTGDFWLNSFVIKTSLGTAGFGTGGGVTYSSPAAALSAVEGQSFSFMVPTQQLVTFMVGDNIFNDNRGGLVLDISAVPEPGSLVLLAAALMAFYMQSGGRAGRTKKVCGRAA